MWLFILSLIIFLVQFFNNLFLFVLVVAVVVFSDGKITIKMADAVEDKKKSHRERRAGKLLIYCPSLSKLSSSVSSNNSRSFIDLVSMMMGRRKESGEEKGQESARPGAGRQAAQPESVCHSIGGQSAETIPQVTITFTINFFMFCVSRII